METIIKAFLITAFAGLILALAVIPPRFVVVNSAGYFNPFKKRVFDFKVVKEGALYYIYFTGDNWLSQVRYTRFSMSTIKVNGEDVVTCTTSGFFTEAGAHREALQFDNIRSVLKDLDRIENKVIQLNSKK